MTSNTIEFDDFAKVEITLGTVIEVMDVPGSDKLYKLKIDFGEYVEVESEGGLTEREMKTRTVFSGIKKYLTPQALIGNQFPFVTNLKPRLIMGEYSEAMILAASEESIEQSEQSEKRELFTLLSPNQKLSNGIRLR
jgi:methionyl-tRNA synthetase